MGEAMKRCWCGGDLAHREAFPVEDYTFACVESKFHDPMATGRPEVVKVLYVSGPMTGYPGCNYPAFNVAADRLRAAGYTVVNPATDVSGTETHYVDFLREDLLMLLRCDGVATLDFWWESVGARLETTVAGTLKMPVRSVDDWLNDKKE